MAGLNPRRHHLVDHTERDHSGHHGFESVTDLDPHLMIFGHNEKGQSVVEPLPAYLPLCEGADGPVLDRRWRTSRERTVSADRKFAVSVTHWPNQAPGRRLDYKGHRGAYAAPP
jgi:hypothetical protein